MKKYFNKYANEAAYEAANNKWPHVSYIEETEEVKYETKPIDYSKQYFTTVALSDGNIGFSGSTATNKLSYSTDEGSSWTTMDAQTVSVPVSNGQKVLWKGEATPQYNNGIGRFTTATTANFNVEGNAMSLLYGDNFQGQTDLTGNIYAFYGLFSGNTHVLSAENMELPATTLVGNCYTSMFQGCTSLRTAPELPATTLANSCYTSMFNNCTSLTVAPQLPATTLAHSCYSSMFNGCTNLTTAPELLAETLADYCYKYMFNGCTSLTTAPELPATTLADSCYSQMFYGCTSLRRAPELPATTLADDCYYSMFYNCSSLTAAPELHATTLASHCYDSMFRGCTSLRRAPALPATTLAECCYYFMFNGCTRLNSITCLATDISASSCTANWAVTVASTGTFTKAASMTSWKTGGSGIPSGWSVQDA